MIHASSAPLGSFEQGGRFPLPLLQTGGESDTRQDPGQQGNDICMQVGWPRLGTMALGGCPVTGVDTDNVVWEEQGLPGRDSKNRCAFPWVSPEPPVAPDGPAWTSLGSAGAGVRAPGWVSGCGRAERELAGRTWSYLSFPAVVKVAGGFHW